MKTVYKNYPYQFPTPNSNTMTAHKNPNFFGYQAGTGFQPIYMSEISLSSVDNEEHFLANHKDVLISNEYCWSDVDVYGNPFYTPTETYIKNWKIQFLNTYADYIQYKLGMKAEDFYLQNFNRSEDIRATEIPVGLDKHDNAIMMEINRGIIVVGVNKDGHVYFSKDIVLAGKKTIIIDKNGIQQSVTIPIYQVRSALEQTKNIKPTNMHSVKANCTLYGVGTHINMLYAPSNTKLTTANKNLLSFVSKPQPQISMTSNIKSTLNRQMPQNTLLNQSAHLDLLLDTDLTLNEVEMAEINKETTTVANVSLTGESHILQQTVCQDSSFAAHTDTYTILIVSDGAGSAELSHIGSARLTAALKRLLVTTYPILLSSVLDTKEPVSKETMTMLKNIITKHLVGTWMDLGTETNQPPEKFFATMLMSITGKEKTFWYKVGDGAIVVQHCFKNTETNQYLFGWEAMGNYEKTKGQFQNQTHFISQHLTDEFIQYGCFDNREVSAIALMSDGIADRLISADQTIISDKMNWIAEEAKKSNLNMQTIYDFTRSNEFLNNELNGTWVRSHNGDDCSIAIMTRKTKQEYSLILQEREREMEQKRLKALAKVATPIYNPQQPKKTQQDFINNIANLDDDCYDKDYVD